VLAKGFIGLLLPLLIVGIGLAWTRRLSWRDLNLVRGTAVFVLIAAPWHVLAALHSPTLFEFYVVDNHLLRFLDARRFVEDDVPISTLGFLVASFLWAFPWGVFLLARPAPDASAIARWRPVIPAWALVIVGFFSLSRFKHEYYALPAFPALAILVGAAWASGRDIRRWLGIGFLGCSAVGAWALWLGAGLTPAQVMDGLAELNVYYRILRDQGVPFPFDSPRPFSRLLLGLGLTLLAGWSVASLCWMSGRRRAAFVSLVAVAGVITALIFNLLDVVEPHHSAKAVSEAIVARAASADVIVCEGSLEYSPALPFYTGRRVLVVNGAVGYFSFGSAPARAERRRGAPRRLRPRARPVRVALALLEPPVNSIENRVLAAGAETTLASGALLILPDTHRHDDPANRAEERGNRRGRASIALAPFTLIRSGTLRTFRDAAIEKDLNGLVACEGSLEMLVEVLAIASDDDELPKLLWLRGLLEKARQRHPRLAPTGRALLLTNPEALVAVQTQHEMSQRQMHPRGRRSLGRDCHVVRSFSPELSRLEPRSRLTSS
jgi:hypothetical protein